MYLHPVPKSFTPPPFQPSIRIGGRLKLQHPVDGSSLFARGRKRSPPLETYNYNFRASSARDSISVEIGNEAKRSSSGGCKRYDDTSYQRQYISIFLLHSLSFQNFQALHFFLSFFSLRFEEGISKRKFLPPWIRLHENDAQPIKIPSGRSSSIFPTRCRLTSAGRIKFQPRSVAGVIVSAFTHHGTEELILRFDRGNKIRNGGSTPTSTSSNSITITVATLFSRRKVDSSGKMDWLTSIKHDRGLDGFSPGLKIN